MRAAMIAILAAAAALALSACGGGGGSASSTVEVVSTAKTIGTKIAGLKLRQAYTPTNQAELNEQDLDLGSSAPAILGESRVLVVGKDGVMRVLDLAALDGHRPGRPETLGGEVQTLETPGDDRSRSCRANRATGTALSSSTAT